jgi:hypothetical protein
MHEVVVTFPFFTSNSEKTEILFSEVEVPRCTLRPKEGMSMLFLRLFVPEHLVLDDKLFF